MRLTAGRAVLVEAAISISLWVRLGLTGAGAGGPVETERIDARRPPSDRTGRGARSMHATPSPVPPQPPGLNFAAVAAILAIPLKRGCPIPRASHPARRTTP